MGFIKLKFILFGEFVNEGEYKINDDNGTISISIERVQNNESIQKMLMGDLQTLGKVHKSHDYHGIFNISAVKINLPYYRDLGTVDLKKECIKILNRLINVSKYLTNSYWINPINEHDLLYFRKIEKKDDISKARVGFTFSTEALRFPVHSFVNNNHVDRVNEILDKNLRIPIVYNLFLDAFNYFTTSQFNIAIVVANTALEIYIEEYLKQILANKYRDTDLQKRLSKATKKSLHDTVRRNFFQGRDHKSLLQSETIYRKVDKIRSYRKLAVHDYATIEENKAFDTIRYIFYFIDYLQEKRSEFNDYILKKYDNIVTNSKDIEPEDISIIKEVGDEKGESSNLTNFITKVLNRIPEDLGNIKPENRDHIFLDSQREDFVKFSAGDASMNIYSVEFSQDSEENESKETV